jgi:hypothetical protein
MRREICRRCRGAGIEDPRYARPCPRCGGSGRIRDMRGSETDLFFLLCAVRTFLFMAYLLYLSNPLRIGGAP